MSWLHFNERVLAEAQTQVNPLLERVKFLAISASNLDEFFMIRLASMGRSIQSVSKTDPSTAERLERIRTAILETVANFGNKQTEALDILTTELESKNIFIVRNAREGEPGFIRGKQVFDEMILPKLQPPEGFAPSKIGLLDNLQLGAIFKSEIWFRLPKTLPSVLMSKGETDEKGEPTGSRVYFFFLDDLLATHLGNAFRLPGAPGFVRLTRDGDFTLDLEEEDTESIPDVVRSGVGTREKGRPVRLQYSPEVSGEVLALASQSLKLVSGQILPSPSTLFLHGMWAMVNQTPDSITQAGNLRYPPLDSRVPLKLQNPSRIFEELKLADVLLHHPYDSFDGYVRWIQAACADPAVEMIEQTIYRMDALSPAIDAIKESASRKKIKVIIELRARFDEMNNLMLAEDLRKAGVEVAFGFGKP